MPNFPPLIKYCILQKKNPEKMTRFNEHVVHKDVDDKTWNHSWIFEGEGGERERNWKRKTKARKLMNLIHY